MLPPPWGIITRAACFIPRNTLRVSTANVRSQCSTSVSTSGPNAPPMPALLNITSSRPKPSTAAATSAATWSSSLTSVRSTRSRSWSATSLINVSLLASLRSPTTTRAPSSRNRSTVALPIPLEPPVMTATLPARRSGHAQLLISGRTSAANSRTLASASSNGMPPKRNAGAASNGPISSHRLR